MSCLDGFRIAREIDLVDLTSLLSTIAIGVYVAVYIEKRKADKRREKDILIEQVQGICDELCRMKARTATSSFDLSEVVQSLKDARMSFSRLGEMLLFCKLRVKRQSMMDIARMLSDLNAAVTYTPVAGASQVQQNSVSNGRMTLSKQNNLAQHRLHHDLLTSFRFVQLEINTL